MNIATVLGISFAFLQLVLIAISTRALKRVTKKTMYSYKVISLIGAIIFFSVVFFGQVLSLLTQPSTYEYEIYHFAGDVINAFKAFTTITTFFILPPLSIYLIISNIVLVKKEGRRLPNVLGILLVVALIVGMNVIFFSYDILENLMNVHSYEGYCISLFIENIFAIIVGYFECLLFGTMFVYHKARKHIPKFNKDYMLILGCYVQEDGEPGGLLKRRIDRALEFAKLQKKESRKELIFIPSGGKGHDEPVAEAVSMRNYLLKRHIDKNKIIVEDESKTTRQNFKLSKEKIDITKNVAFATSAYHVFRAGVIASNVGLKNVEGIGSKSPWYYNYTALIREFIANVNSEKRMHMRNVIVIIASLGTGILIGYLANIL